MTTTFKPISFTPVVGALVWLCLGTAWAQQVCNSNIALTRPDSRYEAVTGTTPAGSEVKDKVTGLVWKRCVEGMSWSGTACTGTYATYTWSQALERARTAITSTATPATAWRLPNKVELSSLVETACYYPSLNANWFPNQPVNPVYYVWSSSPYARSADIALGINFIYGHDYAGPGGGVGNKTSSLLVRLVRSSQ